MKLITWPGVSSMPHWITWSITPAPLLAAANMSGCLVIMQLVR